MRDEINIKIKNVIYVCKLDIDNSAIDVSFNRYLILTDSPLATSVSCEYNIEAFLDVVQYKSIDVNVLWTARVLIPYRSLSLCYLSIDYGYRV